MAFEDEEFWYCVRAQNKREHVAAAHIRAQMQSEAFCPRIEIHRKTSAGKKRFIEALFPGYLFVRVNLSESYRHLLAMQGVTGLVHFGEYYPVVPARYIEEIRQLIPDELLDCTHLQESFQPGHEAVISEGPFRDFLGKVCAVDQASQRVNLLIDFLGRELRLEVPSQSLMPTTKEPPVLLRQQYAR